MGRGILILLMAALVSVSVANAATIYGTVYDLSLEKANNAEVYINSSPKQFMVARNSTYSFEVPNGLYVIKARQIQKNSVISLVEENITVKQEGNYVIDLILFPEIDSGLEEPEPVDINENFLDAISTKNYSWVYFIAAVAIIIFAVLVYYIKKNMAIRKKSIQSENEKDVKEDSDDELKKLIGIIKQEGGRITQKEIRKQIPLSEAKISLMISELEHKGVIEKIKRGRGNIIILKKN